MSEYTIWDRDQEKHLVVGTVEYVETKMRVGNGNAVHNGRKAIVTITVPHTTRTKKYDWSSRVEVKEWKVGDTFEGEPHNFCGANANLRPHGYASFYRNGNRSVPEATPVTCTKCLRKEAKRAALKEAAA